MNLHLTGLPCLVVGGGPVAARKVRGLLEAGAEVQVVATHLGDDVRALDVPLAERPYRPEDLEGMYLVVTATGDPAVDGAVHADALDRHVFVNAADDPAHCTVTLAAVHRQGDLTVAVSTGGRSPALAAWVRDRLAVELGPDYATLLEVLAEERDRLRGEGISTEGLDWRGALESGMLEDIGNGRVPEAKERLRACLSSSSD